MHSCRRNATTPAPQLADLVPGVASTEVVPWEQVQGFLDMAESALRAKNAANSVSVLLIEQQMSSAMPPLTF